MISILEVNSTELIGYFGSFMVLVSFLMKDFQKLRVINTIGCGIFVIYGYLLQYSFPIIITNLAIILINLYYLIVKK